MRLTLPTHSAHVGHVEIRGVQRVVELEASSTFSSESTQSPTFFPWRNQHQSLALALALAPPSTQAVPPYTLQEIQSRTAIVVPCKDEKVERILGVWAAIPASSLIILVSGSEPENYTRERDALADFCHMTGRNAMAIHQCDPKVADALRAVGMTALLNDEDGGDGLVYKGKGEGLVIGIALAATARGPPEFDATKATFEKCDSPCPCPYPCREETINDEKHGQNIDVRCDNGWVHYTIRGSGNGHGQLDNQCRKTGTCNSDNKNNADGPMGYYKYIGFIDADNFVPGSVQEYCRAFSAGLHLAEADDVMVRINWASKPKIKDGRLEFKRSGRSSEIVNNWFNKLLAEKKAHIVPLVTGENEVGHGGRGKKETETEIGETTETNLICTGNAGEHAMTMSLALKLRLASGYAIEPFHFMDIFERFEGDTGRNTTYKTKKDIKLHMGPSTDAMPDSPPDSRPVTRPVTPRYIPSSPILSSPYYSAAPSPVDCSPILTPSEGSTSPTSSSVVSLTDLIPHMSLAQQPPPAPFLAEGTLAAGQTITPPRSRTGTPLPNAVVSKPKVQILQIRTLNPHFHDNKGEAHVVRMWKQGLSAIYHSPVTGEVPRYRNDLRNTIFAAESGGNLPTPLPSGSVSRGRTPPPETQGQGKQLKNSAAAGWQPERCRIYPPTGEDDLFELRRLLEGSGGSFWWSGKHERDDGPAEVWR